MVAQPLPKWAMLRYAKLWQTYGSGSFTYQQAQEVLKDNDNTLSVTISRLKKSGWLTIQLDPDDARKRNYRLESPEKVVGEMQS